MDEFATADLLYYLAISLCIMWLLFLTNLYTGTYS